MIALGCDHAGYYLKNEILKYLTNKNISFYDIGCFSYESCDYPEIALKAANQVAAGKYKFAILCCGTGVGMSIAANKIKGVRAACLSDCFSAKYTRMHNDANVLCLGARVVGTGLALDLVDIFLNTEFKGGRHQQRIKQIKDIEEQFNRGE